MKMNILQMGTPLSKEEQRAIKGGRPCPTGETVECECADGTNIFTGESPDLPLQLCNESQYCGSHGGTRGVLCV